MPAALMTPNPEELKLSNHDLWLHELVNGSPTGNAPGSPACVAWAVLGPGESTLTHRHDMSWTYVILLSAGDEGAITQLGLAMDEVHVQHPGQVIVIPPGIPHRARNPSGVQFVSAIELRTCDSAFDDRILLPKLDRIELPVQPRPQRRKVTFSATQLRATR